MKQLIEDFLYRIFRMYRLSQLIREDVELVKTHAFSNNGTGADFYREQHDAHVAEYNSLLFSFQEEKVPFKKDECTGC